MKSPYLLRKYLSVLTKGRDYLLSRFPPFFFQISPHCRLDFQKEQLFLPPNTNWSKYF